SFHNRSAMSYPCDGGLKRDSALITRLAESGQPINLEDRDTQFQLQSENGDSNALLDEEREVLRNLTSALLLPIMSKEGLLGVISICAHLGDLPFSSEDKRLLLSVGGPTSFALENIRPIERTIEDGTLTVAVGDATGHGLKAGTVVSAMKSLFRS